MAKKKKVSSGDAALDMTPMIDVVFQLIIFFVVTLKEEIKFSHLDAMAPAPDSKASPSENLTMITIDIYNAEKQGGHGFLFNKQPVRYDQLDKELSRAARSNDKSTVMLRCTKDSPHSLLVKALDLCSKNGMTNLAVFTI